jgi:predicted dehydrogenase
MNQSSHQNSNIIDFGACLSDRRTFLGQAAGVAGAVGGLAALGGFPSVATAATRSQADSVGVGVIGLGKQGSAILGELAKMENAKILGLSDSDDGRLQRGLRKYQGVTGDVDYRKLLENKAITSIVIATPTHQHKDIALAAIAAGKNVYCEGPMAHTAADAREMAKAAAGVKTVFAVGHEGRSNPIYKLARKFYKSDAIRDLMGMHAQANQKTSWRIPGDGERGRALNWRLDKNISLGLAGEIGSHQIDVVHWYTGKYPVSVTGRGAVRMHQDGREVADTIFATLAFDDGTNLQYSATLGNSFGGKFETFFGSNAAIKLAWTAGWMFKEADAPTQGWEVYANRQQFHNDEGITLIADATKLAAQGKLKDGVGIPNPPVYYGLWDFLVSVSEGKPVACSADEGLRNVVVCSAMNKAIVTGNEVKINPDELKV